MKKKKMIRVVSLLLALLLAVTLLATLTGCGGKLDYTQGPLSSYSLYSDFYWYEIGDVICIGDSRMLYYCFPKCEGDFVAKTRLATEEIYKLAKVKRKR